MSQIKLNIYKGTNKKEIEKTYTVEGYDLMLGTIDDFLAIFDPEKLDNNIEIAKMIVKAYGQVKPLIMDVFPELTDEEFRNIKINDLVLLIGQLGTAVVESFDELRKGNLKRA